MMNMSGNAIVIRMLEIYLERPRFGFGEHTEHESSEQLLNELFDGVRAPCEMNETKQNSVLINCNDNVEQQF